MGLSLPQLRQIIYHVVTFILTKLSCVIDPPGALCSGTLQHSLQMVWQERVGTHSVITVSTNVCLLKYFIIFMYIYILPV